MYRNGYKDIFPLGKSYDRGRDAEVGLYHGKNNNDEHIFFQFSLEKKWESKLYRELERVKNYGHKITKFIFITSQNVTGYKIDQIKKEAENKYGWNLIIYHREWLRIQLEEAHKDLAIKYLGISDEFKGIERNVVYSISPHVPENQSDQVGWQLYIEGRYEEAIPKLKAIIEKTNNKNIIYNIVAWCYFILYNYKEALKYIEYSLDINPTSNNAMGIKGCILTEDGINSRSKLKLLSAKEIFEDLLEKDENWRNYYNLANTLSTLGEYEKARDYYLKALQCEENDLIWKNLGTAYFHLDNHEKEIECLDKALALNPNNVEALISKGVTLGSIFKRYNEGLEFINIALEKNNEIKYRWPHVWFWKAKFLIESNNYEEALNEINKGLKIVPDYLALLNLKARILSQLWKRKSKYLNEAKNFFEFMIKLNKKEIESLGELALIYNKLRESNKSLLMLIKIVNIFSKYEINFEDLSYMNISFKDLFSLVENINLYGSYREYRPVIVYFNDIPLDVSSETEKKLWLAWGISFSKSAKIVKSANTIDKRFIKNLFKRNKQVIENYISPIARNFSKEYKDLSVDIKIERLSLLLVYLPEIFLREFSSEVGYVSGCFGIDCDLIDKALIGEGDNLSKWLKDQITPILFSSNQELKLFDEDN